MLQRQTEVQETLYLAIVAKQKLVKPLTLYRTTREAILAAYKWNVLQYYNTRTQSKHNSSWEKGGVLITLSGNWRKP